MYTEEELVPISALQHILFCERQCALIHVERLWEENVMTLEGRIMHEKAHSSQVESRGNCRMVRGLPLRSLEWGLVGVSDVVEFHRLTGDQSDQFQVFVQEGKREYGPVPGLKGYWRPFPVEYKRGKPKKGNSDVVQLCGQALCLEEMLSVDIVAGAIFYGKTQHRLDVEFDRVLREKTQDAIRRVQRMIKLKETPAPVNDKRCKDCSLRQVCLPWCTVGTNRVQSYMDMIFKAGQE